MLAAPPAVPFFQVRRDCVQSRADVIVYNPGPFLRNSAQWVHSMLNPTPAPRECATFFHQCHVS